MGSRKINEAPSLDYNTRSSNCVRESSPSVHRRRSNQNITIEELSDDEYAYDGDIEVVRPDEYEDVDSDTEGFYSPPILHDLSYWQNKLAEKLTTLNCNSDTNESQENIDMPRNRKRRPRDHPPRAEVGEVADEMSASLEVVELVDGSANAPPAKRRRRKSQRSRTSEKIIHNLTNIKADPRDTGKSSVTATTTSASSSASPAPIQTPIEDLMEVD
jgi:hypothetical protein